MIPEDGQTFFQAELKPIAQGDAVAGPIVKVFVRNDGLDKSVIAVGRGFRIGQNVLVVEDVQALVLHRTHVEVADGDNHVDIEIVLEAETLLVPTHRLLQGVHCVAAAVLFAVLDINPQVDVSAGRCREPVFGYG